MKNLYLQTILAMEVITSSQDLEAYKLRLNGKPIALVPTMGALHDGHLELAANAKAHGYLVLVSIFVNPRQFNNPLDLDKYPRTEEKDKEKLQKAGIDAVYLPKYNDIYEEGISDINLSLGDLGNVYEGYYRPGHFDGVVQVLYRFFERINPQAVFFGEKDLQQCMVVKRLLGVHFPFIQYYQVPTVREISGLAMSSRNQRLSPQGLVHASQIYKVLMELKEQCEQGNFDTIKAIQELKKHAIDTEYLDWVELPELKAIKTTQFHNHKPQALIFAGYLEGVRLIDNLVFGKNDRMN